MSQLGQRQNGLLGTVAANFRQNGPGVLLCVAVSGVAFAAEQVQASLFGRAWLGSIVLAILFGALLRPFWTPQKNWCPGITFSAKTLLEVAVVCLGASLSATTIATVGAPLFFAIASLVFIVVGMGYGICRMFGLPQRIAVLVACGNAICGNSAIAAIAPVIGADSDDVAASIAFTAMLGIVAVLALPLLIVPLGLTSHQFGVLSGLTVYAVPQVIAATAQVSQAAVEIGTVVKLVRVLMLGLVVVVVAMLSKRLITEVGRTPFLEETAETAKTHHVTSRHLLPWFIIGFLAMAALRSFGLIPEFLLAPLAVVTSALTIISMSALGLGVEIGSVAKAGPRVAAATTLSLLSLMVVSFCLIKLIVV